MAKYTGTGALTSADFKDVKWVGKDKAGNAVTITLKNAINKGNLDWTFAEKSEVVASVTFEACYENTDEASTSTTEPWTLEYAGNTSGASEIILGAGIFYIGETAIALTRGGGQFVVNRVFRDINADGDRGSVKDRVSIDEARPTLTMNVLTILTKVADIYSGITTVV